LQEETVFSRQQLEQQLNQVLGEKLSHQELDGCLAAVEILEPTVARQFWQTTEAKAGIYLILAGKVRLLDSSENLITTLTTGGSFGEMTLFGKQEFQPYAARSAVNLKLGFFEEKALQEVMCKYPIICDRLFARAEMTDVLLCCQKPLQGMLGALSLFERHQLAIGSVSASLPPDAKLWLLYKGQLEHCDGYILTPGNILALEPEKQASWQATLPTTLYVLRNADWETALQHCPQLGELVDDEQMLVGISPKPQTSSERISARNVIPFPQRDFQSQPQPKSDPYFPTPKVAVGHLWERLTKSYPFFAQHSASDCGAACLVMIGRHWGKHFSANKVRELTNVNHSGASLPALAVAAETLGFISRPVKASLDKLAEQALPAIAHWQGKHYIVVYEITKKRVIICDPAIGQRNLTRAEFNDGWTGYALLLQPTAALQDTEVANSSLWRFFDLVKPHWRVLLEVFLASLLLQVFGLITPIFTQLLLDRVIVQGSTITLTAVSLGLIIFGLFSIVMNAVRQYLLAHTANRVSVALLVGFIKHTFRLPLSFFESRYVGDIVSRIEENEKIQRFLTGETLSIILDLLTIVIYLAVMFWYNKSMTLLVLLIVPPFFILALASTNILRRMSREIFNAGAEENSYLIQSLTGIRSVRSMAIEQTVRWHWEELLHTLVKKGFNAQVIGIRLQVISASIDTLMSAGLLWYGAWLVINQELTIGQLIAFNMLMGNVISPFKRLAGVWNQLQEIFISVERLNDVLEAKPEEDLLTCSRKPLSTLRAHIRFDNVTFRYHPESDVNILENISFEILPEQMIAVVGRSGSGKTTLSKLILGLYPPTDGKVLIDGHDLKSIALRSLRTQIGVVDQDNFLFGGTVKENIGIAHPHASLEEITEAAHLAGADEFIQQLPMGYETQIGEGGGMLSGGQRQRLAIARALLGNPRLLIFDEATSNLDAESEHIIQNNLKTILKGRTSLVIAHRLSTVRHADLILVLDHGVLVESGTHEELIAKKGHYFYLNQQQLDVSYSKVLSAEC
jgi:ATP-binding cassette subfamily B protein